MSSQSSNPEVSGSESNEENSNHQTSSPGSSSRSTSASGSCDGSSDVQSSRAINLTPRALEELKKLLQQELAILARSHKPDPEAIKVDPVSTLGEVLLRVAVKGGGCSGFSYDMRFTKRESVRDGESIEDFDGFRVVVDQTSLLYLQGTTIDYTEGLDGRGFVFDNPNTTGRCGCGSSFSV